MIDDKKHPHITPRSTFAYLFTLLQTVKKKGEIVLTFPQLRVSRRFRTQFYCAEVIKWNKRRVDNTVRVHRTAERRKERSRETYGCVRRDERKRRGRKGERDKEKSRREKEGSRDREDLDSRLIAV